MRWEEEKEAFGLLSRLFGRDAYRVKEVANEESVQDLLAGERAFNKAFLRYLHQKYGSKVTCEYFRTYSQNYCNNPFLHLTQVRRNLFLSREIREDGSSAHEMHIAA